MAVGKRIYLKRKMPDHEVMMQFKEIPASNDGGCNGTKLRDEPKNPSGEQSEGADDGRAGIDDKSKKRR